MLSSSERLRKKQEAANVYIARMKTVDASLLTTQRSQMAQYSGYTVNNQKSVTKCIPHHKATDMYTRPYVADSSMTTNNLSQQQDRVSRAAGGVLAYGVRNSTASPGIQRLNCQEVSTILHPYQPKNYPSVKAECGFNRYFPSADSNSSCSNCSKSSVRPCDKCSSDKTVFSSG